MHGSLNPFTATKLAKICGLLGSDHAGERAAAAWQATRLLRGCNLTWEDLVLSSKATPATRQPAYTGWRGAAATCQARSDLLNTWERQFLADILNRRGISSKQADILARLVARVRAAGGAEAP